MERQAVAAFAWFLRSNLTFLRNSVNTSSSLASPHRGIVPTDAREVFALRLLDSLWRNYRDRVSYVRDYEEIVETAGGTFENDHIAFRTLASQDPLIGIATLSRLFEALGYEPAGCYIFPVE